MVIVIAKVPVKPECKKALLDLAQGVMAATRAEEGCISYTLLDNTYDSGQCVFVEEWADLDALRKIAFASPEQFGGFQSIFHVLFGIPHD